MIETYEALKDLLDEKLNANTYEILFDTTLFNSGKISYTSKVDVDGTYQVQEKQVVPAHITEINSRYINIPNTNSLEASIGIEFDVFVRDYLTLNNIPDQTKYKSVSYNNTQLSINEMQRNLLAQKFQLGDSGIHFGGEDSTGKFTFATPFVYNTIYLNVDIKEEEEDGDIFYVADGTDIMYLKYTDTDIEFHWNFGAALSLSTPFTYGVNEIVIWRDANGNWNLTVEGTTVTQADVNTPTAYTELTISPILSPYEGLNGILYQVIVDDAIITLADVSDVETAVSPALINLADFDDRYEFNQEGTYTLVTNTITNSILWGSLGNVVFSFEGLVPIGDMFFNDDGYPRQMFYLNIPCLISNDLIFGNSTEYYLDDVRIYPVDRKTTYGTQMNTETYINGLTATSIAEQNMRDLETTFFYKSSRKLNNVFKHVVSNASLQNTVYELVVQYPFWKETYNVIIDSGGSSNNVNSFHTFSVTYKNKDASLT
jgi:hypothetical protein